MAVEVSVCGSVGGGVVWGLYVVVAAAEDEVVDIMVASVVLLDTLVVATVAVNVVRFAVEVLLLEAYVIMVGVEFCP